jgi:hypothetical protein
MRTEKLLIIASLAVAVALLLRCPLQIQTFAAENPIVIGLPAETESAEAAKHFHGNISTAVVAAVYPADNPRSLDREFRDPLCSANSPGLSVLRIEPNNQSWAVKPELGGDEDRGGISFTS